jgi:GT2 family glycosyltransferase
LSDLSQEQPIPKVSVIIVNWNGERFLERSLAALMVQTVKPHEVIILDNASTDRSIEIIRRFPFVQLMLLDQNTGFARGNNLAVAATDHETEWIALLNPDAFASPNWLEALLNATLEHPDYDVFGSKQLIAAELSLLDGLGDAYHMSGLPWRKGFGQLVTEKTDMGGEIFAPCAAAALYRKRAFIEVGGFDEDYFCYIEDVDIGFRLRLAGYRCLYVPEAVIAHVGSGTTESSCSDFSLYHSHRNLVWTYIKNMPTLLFWLLLPLHIGLNLTIILWFAIKHGKGKLIWSAKWAALIAIPKTWRKRRIIQSRRVVSNLAIWRVLDKTLVPLRRNRI